LLALATGMTMLLSACRVDSVLTVRVERDGSGTVTLEAIADAAVVQAAPGLAEDLRLDDAVAAGWTVEGPLATETGGLRVVLTRAFASVDQANALLQSVNGPSGPLRGVTLVRSGGVGGDGLPDGSDSTVELRGQLGVEGGLDAFADPALLDAVGATPYAADLAAAGVDPADALSFRLDVSVPGDVTEGGTGAESEDGTLRWTAPLDGSSLDLATVFAVSGSSGSGWSTLARLALIGLVGWCVLAAGLIAAVSRARTRRLRAAAQRSRRPGGTAPRRPGDPGRQAGR
jgi:hypothetical protein